MTVDIVAFARVEEISIVGVRVINKWLRSASGFAIERDSLPVTLSESILSVRLELLDRAIAGCTTIDNYILHVSGAVTTAVGQDFDCKTALDADGSEGGKELGIMHFQMCWK